MSEEFRNKVTAKYGQCEVYKTIFKEPEGPVTTVDNVINTLKALGTVDNIYESKTDPRLNWLVEDEEDSTGVAKMTSYCLSGECPLDRLN